jgi:hypothetical protein
MRESAYDPASFAAGRHSGMRFAAQVARLAARELIDRARWWNRRKYRVMARALVACAEELEREIPRREPRPPPVPGMRVASATQNPAATSAPASAMVYDPRR